MLRHVFPQVQEGKQADFDYKSWQNLADQSLKRANELQESTSAAYQDILKKRTGWLVFLRVCSCHLVFVSES